MSNSPRTPPAASATHSAAASPDPEQDPALQPAVTARTPEDGQGAGAASADGSSGGGGGGAKGPSSQKSQEKAVQTEDALMGAAEAGRVRAGDAVQAPAPKRQRLMSGMEAVWKVFGVSQPLPSAWNSPLPADLGF